LTRGMQFPILTSGSSVCWQSPALSIPGFRTGERRIRTGDARLCAAKAIL